MYNTKYILAFENDLNELYEIYFELLNYVGVSTPIFGASDCLHLRSTTGDQNKLEPILGTECLINIVVGKVNVGGIEWDNSSLSIDDLIAQHDNDIRVTVYKNRDYTKSVFQGFVVVEDNNQPFLDPPFTLSLRALDGLGLLKGVDFVDTTGSLFVGSLTVLDWLAQLLYKTGQTLNIRVYFNFINTAFPNIEPILAFKIAAITFQISQPQTTIDPSVDVAALEADDCYTALEKLVRNMRCRLFQEDGVWNLVNLYEYANPMGYSFQEYQITDPVAGYVGTNIVATASGKNYDINVGGDQIIHPVSDDAVRYLKLGTKWVKMTYTYDQSLNKICNQTFTDLGAAIPTYKEQISDEIIDKSLDTNTTNNPLPTLGYAMFCWDHFNSPSNLALYPSQPPTKRYFIRQVNDALGYEIVRFGVIDDSGTTNVYSYAAGSKILIDTNDILQIDVSYRLRLPNGILFGVMYVSVNLTGDDGTFWSLFCTGDNARYPDPSLTTKWAKVDSNFQTTAETGSGVIGNTIFCAPGDDAFIDKTAWSVVTINNTVPVKTPVQGTIQISIVNALGNTNNELWFKDLQVKILPYLQGSYSQLKGDFNYSASNNLIKQTDDETVEISDSPKRYFKGALLQEDGKTLMPLEKNVGWIRRGFLSDTPARFTNLMEKIVYNNLVHIVEKIEGSYRGLTYVDAIDPSIVRMAGYINSYFFPEHPVPDKKFILTSFDKDLSTGIGRHVFVEILKDQNDTGWADPDSYVFQYIFQ